MSRIKAKNTSPELMLRKALWHAGLRGYRTHYKLIGKPDIVFRRKRLVIFIDGDYWHGHLWKKRKKVPPRKYWQAKIKGNMERDKKYTKELKKDGWKVLRFWEHQIKSDVNKCLGKIKKYVE